MDERIRVAVVESEEVLGRGVVACLADDRRLRVTAVTPSDALAREFDVAVVSSEAAAGYRFPCPIVVCGNGYVVSSGLTAENEVAALLHRGSMTCEQLRASVHAAMTGLKVKPPDPAQEQLDARSLHVLELIADGLSTREIADALSFSERTIKKLISGLERTLGARNRAHAAALAIRQGLIPHEGQRRATSEPPRDDPAATLPERQPDLTPATAPTTFAHRVAGSDNQAA